MLFATSRWVRPSSARARPVDVDEQGRRVDDLVQVHVDRARNARHPGGDLEGDLVGRLLVVSRHLHVDRRRQPEVQDLAHDVGGLEVERDAGELAGQRLPQGLHPARRRLDDGRDSARRGSHRPRADGHAIGEGQVDRLRLADVVDHQLDLVLRDEAADRRLDLRRTPARSPRSASRPAPARAGGTARCRPRERNPARRTGAARPAQRRSRRNTPSTRPRRASEAASARTYAARSCSN